MDADLQFEALTRIGPATVRDRAGRTLVLLGGCDYLCLSQHPAVVAALHEQAQRSGLSAGASRTTTGNHPNHEQLEADLAWFLRAQAAVLLPDGYTANIAACQAARSVGCTHALIHPRAHPSLTDAARAAGLAAHPWPTDARCSTAPAERPHGPAAWLTDGVFTGDGSVAEVHGVLSRLGPSDLLILDDCHGFAAIGEGGRGSAFLADPAPAALDPRVLLTTTLAKGLGAAGGAVVCTEALARAVRGSSAFVCTTPIGPALAAASIAALRVLRAEPDRPARACSNARVLREALGSAGLPAPPSLTPIVTFALADAGAMRDLAARLRDAGYLAPLIRYPGGPAPCYFRLIGMSEHDTATLHAVADVVSTTSDHLTTRL